MINVRTLIMSPGFDFAAKFYETFSTDVSYYGDQILVEAKRISRVTMNSVADLLNALKLAVGEKNFLIACHGSPDGLLIPVAPGHKSTLTGQALNLLLGAADGASGARGGLVAATDKLGKKLFAKESQVDDLLTLIKDVRASRIELVEFRCCNLGAGVGLKNIHKLLGSRLTAAPKVKYVWLEGTFSGQSRPPKTPAEWKKQLEVNAKRIGNLPPNRRTFTRDDCIMSPSSFAKGSEVVAGMSVIKEGPLNRYDLTGYFQDWESVKGWTQVYLENSYYYYLMRGFDPPGGGFRRGGKLYVIGFYTPAGPLPFVFPGDGFNYTGQIAYER